MAEPSGQKLPDNIRRQLRHILILEALPELG